MHTRAAPLTSFLDALRQCGQRSSSCLRAVLESYPQASETALQTANLSTLGLRLERTHKHALVIDAVAQFRRTVLGHICIVGLFGRRQPTRVPAAGYLK